MRKFSFVMLMSAALSVASAVNAASLSFDGSWSHQKFPLKSATSYGQSGSLSIESNGGVSILYKRVPSSLAKASSASWSWSVSQSVPPTNLKAKGGDDRNASIYFVFAPAAEADALSGQKITSLLSNKSVKALVYTHGGDRAGIAFQNPYMQGRGQSIVLRASGTGKSNEGVNLGRDFANAFGGGDYSLIGIGISADSDDTKSQIRATLSPISLN